MKVSAIQCDDNRCREVVRDERAAADGWLTIGGGRRGRARLDLCPMHARMAIRQISEGNKRKRARREERE